MYSFIRTLYLPSWTCVAHGKRDLTQKKDNTTRSNMAKRVRLFRESGPRRQYRCWVAGGGMTCPVLLTSVGLVSPTPTRFSPMTTTDEYLIGVCGRCSETAESNFKRSNLQELHESMYVSYLVALYRGYYQILTPSYRLCAGDPKTTPFLAVIV